MAYLKNRDDIISLIKNHPEKIRRLWIESGFESQYNRFIKQAKEEGVSFKVIPKGVFSKRFRDAGAHICLEVDEYTFEDPDTFLEGLKESNKAIFLSAFDGIYDPQNLGNIIRSAACFGVHGLILPKDRSCGITDAVVRVSKGGLEHVRLIRVTNLTRYIEGLKKAGIFCYCLDEKAERSLSDIDLRSPVCLVFGSEDGVRRLTRERCDEVVSIPTLREFASLNVATCFAVSAYEVLRQRASK